MKRTSEHHAKDSTLRTALKGISSAMALGGLIAFSPATLAGTIGYVVLGNAASTSPEAAITAAGHTPRALGTFAAGNLTGVDVLWILNPSNGGYAADLSGNLTKLNNFVAAGGTLLFHDRFVTDAAGVIPGATGITFVRNTATDNAQIQTTAAAPSLLTGPGGTITDTTLDGGNSSSHGYAVVATLPNGAVVTLTRPDPTQAVDFHYTQDSGVVYYSTIPLDFYLAGGGSVTGFSQIYAVNLAAFIFNVSGGAQAIATPAQHVQMPAFWEAARRMGDLRTRLSGIPGAGRDRLVAQSGPLQLAAAEPVAIGSPAKTGAGGFFVEVADSRSGQNARSGVEGYAASSTGVTFGFESALRPDLAFGISLGYDDTNTDMNGGGGKSSSQLYSITGYARKYLSDLAASKAMDWYIDGVLGGRVGDIDVSRTGGISGETRATQGYLSLSLGADFVAGGAMTVSPYVGTQYVQTRIAGFTEVGTGGLTYSTSDSSQWEMFLGGRVARRFAVKDVDLVGKAALELHQSLDQRNPNIHAGLVGVPGTTSRISTLDVPDTYASIKVGLEVSVKKNVAGYVDLSGYSSTDGAADGYSASAGLRVSF